MPADELLCPHAFLIAWFADMERLNNLCQCAMKSNELIAAGAGDISDFHLESIHVYVLLWYSIPSSASFLAREDGRICRMPLCHSV